MIIAKAEKTIYAAALLAAALIGGNLALAQAHAQTAPANVAAKQNVTLASMVQIERDEVDAKGKTVTKLFTPNDVSVVPGDKLIFTLSYKNIGSTPAANFVATNPMPGPVTFTSANEDWAEVSVDGGKNWGKLVSLTVNEKKAAAPSEGNSETVAQSTSRSARASDVTHVRWVFPQDIKAGKSGTLSFRGSVK